MLGSVGEYAGEAGYSRGGNGVNSLRQAKKNLRRKSEVGVTIKNSRKKKKKTQQMRSAERGEEKRKGAS